MCFAEKCEFGAEPQRSREGNIIWCKNNNECLEHHTCTPIEGLFHFGIQVRYCCPTRSIIIYLFVQLFISLFLFLFKTFLKRQILFCVILI